MARSEVRSTMRLPVRLYRVVSMAANPGVSPSTSGIPNADERSGSDDPACGDWDGGIVGHEVKDDGGHELGEVPAAQRLHPVRPGPRSVRVIVGHGVLGSVAAACSRPPMARDPRPESGEGDLAFQPSAN